MEKELGRWKRQQNKPWNVGKKWEVAYELSVSIHIDTEVNIAINMYISFLVSTKDAGVDTPTAVSSYPDFKYHHLPLKRKWGSLEKYMAATRLGQRKYTIPEHSTTLELRMNSKECRRTVGRKQESVRRNSHGPIWDNGNVKLKRVMDYNSLAGKKIISPADINTWKWIWWRTEYLHA